MDMTKEEFIQEVILSEETKKKYAILKLEYYSDQELRELKRMIINELIKRAF